MSLSVFQREVTIARQEEYGIGFTVEPVRTLFHPIRQGGWEVSKVLPKSPAAAAMLLPGDYIVSMNGKDVRSAALGDVKQLLSQEQVVLVLECSAVLHLQTSMTTLKKIRQDKIYERKYSIDPSCTRIQWMSTSKPAKEATIYLSDIKDVMWVCVIIIVLTAADLGVKQFRFSGRLKR